MATFFDPTHGQSQTGLPLGTVQGEPLYPQYPGLSALLAQPDLPTWPPSITPDYNPSAVHLDPPPSFSSIVGSVYPLTLASQLDTPQHVPSTCNGTGSLYPVTYPKIAHIHSSWEFRNREQLCQLPPVVSPDYMAAVPVLSSQLLTQIDQLKVMDYDEYHPWQNDESNPVHAIITKVMSEVTAKFPKDATPEGFMNRLAFCEKAINEIELLPTLISENKVMLELGIRDSLAKYIEVFEANKLGDVYESTKVIPNHLENIPFYLNQFATRGGHYLPSRVVDQLGELLNTIRHHFSTSLSETFARQNIASLPLSEQFTRCHALIKEQLQPFASSPAILMRLEFAAHQALTQSLIEHHAPLCKEAYEKGQPLPLDLSYMLDNLYFLASNNSSFILYEGQDPRQSFVQSVFGTDNIADLREQIKQRAIGEIAMIEHASTAIGEPAKPKGFFSMFNFFSKEPSPEELARQAASRKATALSQVDAKQKAQGLAIDQLEGYVTGQQQPITMPEQFKPSAPPFDMVESLYPQLSTTQPSLVVADKPASLQPTLSAINPVASNKVTLTFPEVPKKPKPTGSYVHIAFHDLLERTKADEDLFAQFPKPVQRDLMRHLFHTRLVGPAEARIEAAFQKNVDGKKVAHINHLYTRELAQLDKQLKTTTRTPEQLQGEEILNLYYQGKQNDGTFLDKLSAYPVTELFLYYVWDIAKNANVEIPETDHDWARGHYKDPHFVHLTMQALERLLHTS
ncbi:MAG: hypothetical protein JSR39_03330 [Verrucomicrobia bacterium]|nr:hypothetical protein [Verrucomicrobiota bacterium]